MRFGTFDRGHGPEAGVIAGDQVISLQQGGIADVVSVIAGGSDALDRARRWVESAPGGETLDLATVKLLAPIQRPPKIICIGLNYRDHAEESKMPIPDVPTVFAKFPTAATGPGQPIVLPRNSAKPDYEAELAVVIGRAGRHIPEEKWREHVFGYTCFNDVSARDFQMATSQWIMGKTFDTFAPFGPAIVTSDEIEDPHNLEISLDLSGEIMQRSNTSEMIFRIPQLITHLSSVFTLEPGDIIATGTPPGVGFARKPPRWLRHGDVATVRISGIGELTNPVVAEPSA